MPWMAWSEEEPTPSPTPAPPPRIRTRAEAYAPEQSMIKPISVDVFVSNDGKASALDVEIFLQLVPEDIGRMRPYPPGGNENSPHEPTLLDPVELDTRIDELYPGRSRKLTFSTPYYAVEGFRNDHGYFMVQNLVPNLRKSVSVSYKISVKLHGEPLKTWAPENILISGQNKRNFFFPDWCHLMELATEEWQRPSQVSPLLASVEGVR